MIGEFRSKLDFQEAQIQQMARQAEEKERAFAARGIDPKNVGSQILEFENKIYEKIDSINSTEKKIKDCLKATQDNNERIMRLSKEI